MLAMSVAENKGAGAYGVCRTKYERPFQTTLPRSNHPTHPQASELTFLSSNKSRCIRANTVHIDVLRVETLSIYVLLQSRSFVKYQITLMSFTTNCPCT